MGVSRDVARNDLATPLKFKDVEDIQSGISGVVDPRVMSNNPKAQGESLHSNVMA